MNLSSIPTPDLREELFRREAADKRSDYDKLLEKQKFLMEKSGYKFAYRVDKEDLKHVYYTLGIVSDGHFEDFYYGVTGIDEESYKKFIPPFWGEATESTYEFGRYPQSLTTKTAEEILEYLGYLYYGTYE